MQQGKATKEASKEETYRGRKYHHNLSPHRTSHLVDDSTAGAHVPPQQANLRLTPMPEAACRQEQPSSPVIALSPGRIRFRRAKVEAPKNCSSRNDTVRRGRWTSGMAMGWGGSFLAFKWLYQCRDYQAWEDKKNGLFPRELSYTISQEGFHL